VCKTAVDNVCADYVLNFFIYMHGLILLAAEQSAVILVVTSYNEV